MPFVSAEQEAILKLQKEAIGTYHLIGTERGGALLSDKIYNGTIRQISSVKKPYPDSKGQHMAMLSSAVIGIINANPDQELTISIAETLVSGSSVNKLIETIEPIASTYRHVNFKVLALQQTINLADYKAEGVTIRKTSKMDVIIQQTPYILGEDVGYQMSKDSKQPITLYSGTGTDIKAIQITPVGEASSRDLIVALAKGKISVSI